MTKCTDFCSKYTDFHWCTDFCLNPRQHALIFHYLQIFFIDIDVSTSAPYLLTSMMTLVAILQPEKRSRLRLCNSVEFPKACHRLGSRGGQEILWLWSQRFYYFVRHFILPSSRFRLRSEIPRPWSGNDVGGANPHLVPTLWTIRSRKITTAVTSTRRLDWRRYWYKLKINTIQKNKQWATVIVRCPLP